MNFHASPFLTAEWRHLAMLTFDIDPKVLSPLVPAGTELDAWQGRTFVSIVGFLFLNTRVFGAAIPCHRDFEEVNLRFYVRRMASDGWRRAVGFVKEIVPRIAIALAARACYGENYVAVPMRHRIEPETGGATGPRTVSYSWWFRGRENRMELSASGDAGEIAEGSDAEFITEHYWGYARRRGGRTTEYRVEHPRWRVCTATAARLDCDVAALYGSQFVEFLKAPPASSFLADGSKVTVFRGNLAPFSRGPMTGPEGPIGWVLYDDSCGFCRRWVPFWGNTLRKRGFAIAPLQSEWVAEGLNVPEEDLLFDLRLLLADGRQVCGADVYRHVMRRIWWAYPLYLLSVAPLLRLVFNWAYRTFANNRYGFSRACRLK